MKYVRVGEDGKFLQAWECSSHSPKRVHSYSWVDLDKASALSNKEWNAIKYKNTTPKFVMELECEVIRKVKLVETIVAGTVRLST